MTQTTGKAPETTVGKLAEEILASITEGHIAHEIENVEIKAKSSPTGKDEKRPFDALYALDADGMSLLCNGKIVPATSKPTEGKDERSEGDKANGACDYFNYGRILSVRARERALLEESLEGPEKSINKLAKTNLEGGMFDTLDEARDAVIARWIKAGKLPTDYVFPTSAKV